MLAIPPSPHSTQRFVLVIDDNPTDRLLYCEWLEKDQGSDTVVMGIESLHEAKSTLETCQPDCIILDHHLLDGTGLDYLAYLSEYYDHMPPIVIFVSGALEDDLGMRAVSHGATTYIPKDKLNAALLNLAVNRILIEGERADAS